MRLHLISVNIAEVMEDILAEVASNFLCSSETVHHLLVLVEAIIAAKCLALALCVLLEKQW